MERSNEDQSRVEDNSRNFSRDETPNLNMAAHQAPTRLDNPKKPGMFSMHRLLDPDVGNGASEAKDSDEAVYKKKKTVQFKADSFSNSSNSDSEYVNEDHK